MWHVTSNTSLTGQIGLGIYFLNCSSLVGISMWENSNESSGRAEETPADSTPFLQVIMHSVAHILTILTAPEIVWKRTRRSWSCFARFCCTTECKCCTHTNKLSPFVKWTFKRQCLWIKGKAIIKPGHDVHKYLPHQGCKKTLLQTNLTTKKNEFCTTNTAN